LNLYESHLLAGERAAEHYALTVPRTLTSGLGGVRLGRRSGSSLEFREYREYQPGDDLRHLDWSAYGRSDRLTVKVFHEEVDPHLDLVVDGSRSMSLAGTEKAAATAGMAALLARAADHAGFSREVYLAAADCRRLGGPGDAPGSWRELTLEHEGTLGESLARLRPLRPRGLRLLLSDLLCDEEPRRVLDRFAHGAASVVVIQLLAAVDASPPEVGFARLVDCETGEDRDLLLDAAAVRRYRAALVEHQSAWRRACREIGAVMVTLVAEEVVEGYPPEALEELVEQEVLALQGSPG
jgi:uncharacterized protein (DUF58 family)